MPAGGSPVRIYLGGPVGIVLGSRSYDAPAVPRPTTTLHLLSYGTKAPLGFDPETTRPAVLVRHRAQTRLSRRATRAVVDVNGHVSPTCRCSSSPDGDVVRMSISNDSGEVHPMHLHGHHAVVLSRNGVPATGSHWWVDSLNVGNG